jgi:hypothetical protein
MPGVSRSIEPKALPGECMSAVRIEQDYRMLPAKTG